MDLMDDAPRVVRAAAMPVDTPALPVAIVGAGACGLTAALMLRDAGIDCVLLERDALPQGSTALSSGFIPAAGTRVQRAAGVDDSPDRFAADIQAKAHGSAAQHLVAAYTQAIAPALDALQARHGLAFELLDGFLYPGHAVRRMNARVHELWCDAAGRVIGLAYRRPDGTQEHLACRALLLACNGFGGNAAMVRELLPEMRDATFAGHAGNDGSAIAWARELGLALADLGGYQGHGSWAVPQGALITWALMMDGGVQVNARGARFHDETQGYSEAAVHVLAQPGGVAWNVFDDQGMALGRGFPDFVDAQAAGAVRTVADVQALAALIGCEAPTLAATLASARRPLGTPLHAIKVTGALFHTQGGIAIDAGCHALRTDGSTHPNLLAAGGAARGVSGNAVWGYLSGNGLLSAVAGGYIAAQSAVRLLEQP
jgi:fumarate reductase flavoprotein subunit